MYQKNNRQKWKNTINTESNQKWTYILEHIHTCSHTKVQLIYRDEMCITPKVL